MLKTPLPKIRVNIFPNKMVHLDASKHHLDLSDLCPKTPLEKKSHVVGISPGFLALHFGLQDFWSAPPKKPVKDG